MNPCENCKIPDFSTCYGCEYAETEPMLEHKPTFADNLEVGWDYAVGQLENEKVDCVIRECMEKYWEAYTYAENNDIDGGKCFEIRQWAINEILKRLMEVIK